MIAALPGTDDDAMAAIARALAADGLRLAGAVQVDRPSAAVVEARRAAGGIDLPRVHTFGRQQAVASRGFRAAIAAAVAAGIPVQPGLPAAHAAAFAEFAGDLGETLPPDPAAAALRARAACAMAAA
jgi:predicted TIM-barrel fold metal-dependent hydrolase